LEIGHSILGFYPFPIPGFIDRWLINDVENATSHLDPDISLLFFTFAASKPPSERVILVTVTRTM
jgi:hypothetical protein